MKNPFDVLGIPRPTKMGPLSAEQIAEAKKAFRKLSMQYHPDREGGNEEKFKEVKTAWEQIESGKLNAQQKQYDIDEILRAFRAQQKGGFHPHRSPFQDFAPTAGYFAARVPYSDAYHGFSLNINININGDAKSGVVAIPPRTANETTNQYKMADGTPVEVTTIIVDPKFRQRDPKGSIKVLSSDKVIAATGDLETTVDVDALDILTGAWITVEDFLHDKFSVRVPQGFDTSNFLKVAGKGYFDWNVTQRVAEEKRCDLYLKLNPIFSKLDKLDEEKVKALYELVKNRNPPKS